jgi:hypothetical protein
VSGEKRTSLAILAIAVMCLILAGVFAPRISAEANSNAPSQYVSEDVSTWLLRLAAWAPAEVELEHPACAEGVRSVGFWDYL